MNEPVRIGVIGGSGVYQIDALADLEEVTVTTPFGEPSDSYFVGTIRGQRVAFLARHGRGHVISPTRLNHRANIYGFKKLGVEYLISANACGSLRQEFQPGTVMVPSQLYDNTRLRTLSFFDDPAVGTAGIVAHIAFAHPFCTWLSAICVQALRDTGTEAHDGGNFITIEGPRFSSRFESDTFVQWGADIIGMTTSPEAQLAREAEMSFAVMAHITDLDTIDNEESVSVEVVLSRVKSNAAKVNAAVVRAVDLLADAPPSPHAHELQYSIQSDTARIAPEQIALLPELLGKYFPTA